jgi:hypothetical protein
LKPCLQFQTSKSIREDMSTAARILLPRPDFGAHTAHVIAASFIGQGAKKGREGLTAVGQIGKAPE